MHHYRWWLQEYLGMYTFEHQVHNNMWYPYRILLTFLQCATYPCLI
jgi:hypothetical protein